MPRYAAVDIGSTSVRVEGAEVVPGLPARVLASDREGAPLGKSVFSPTRATADIDLEQWAVERADEAFRQVYNRPISVVKAKD